MPDTEIVPEISAVKINLDGNAEGVDFTNSVSLMCEAEPVLFDGVYENGAYTMMLTNGALKANSDYTLRVDNGNEAYAYSFRTKAGRVIISAFELQKEGAKAQLADLKVNDRVYVKLHIINTSGSAQKMTASISSYQGFLMNGFDYSDITLDADELSYDSESLSLTVTNTENLDIKGFLWSDFETLRPLTDTAELVK